MKIYDSFGPVTAAEIAVLERMLSIKLPAAYKDFLEQYNGGAIRPNSFRYMDVDSQQLGWIDSLYGIAEEANRYSLLKNWKICRKNLPDRMIPIGEDGVGNYICISVAGSDIGKVYYMLHEWPPEDEDNLFLIADDFNAFLESLFENEGLED